MPRARSRHRARRTRQIGTMDLLTEVIMHQVTPGAKEPPDGLLLGEELPTMRIRHAPVS